MPITRRSSWYNACLRRLVAILAVLGVGATILLAQSAADDPVPIQRIFLKPDRAAKELAKAPHLLILPRKDFEDRLERLRQAQQAREQKPHLTEARYSAELIDRSFTSGAGQWSILHGGTATAVLPVEPFNLAIAKPRWEQGGDAIFAELDGKSLGLLVKPAVSNTCLFDWSVRGTPTSEGIAFSLAVPPSPVSTFDLTLPADHWLFALKSAAVVTGPFETGSAAKRLWKMQITGTKPIDILVRKIAEGKGSPAVIFARTHTTQQLAPDLIAVEHKYQLDVVHGSVRELVLEADAGLQPFSVVWPGGAIKDYTFQEMPAIKDAKGKPAAGAAGLLTIVFSEPVQGKIQGLQVKSLLASSAANAWTSPALRVRNALSRGETLEVRLHPNMPVGKWDHGTFQPLQIATDPDGTQRLTLADTVSDTPSSRRPTLWAPAKGVDLHTTENYRWQITQRGAVLAAEIHYALSRGQLFELRLKLPKAAAGYQIDALQMQPAEMLRGWRPDGGMLVVDMQQPLSSVKKATLKVQLRATLRELAAGNPELTCPELDPVEATKREGTLAVEVDPIFRPSLIAASAPLGPADEDEQAKLAILPSYRFNFRDKRPSVTLKLVPQAVQVQLHGKHSIALAEAEAKLQFRWDVQPLVGAPDFLDFRFAPGFPAHWKVNGPEDTLRIQRWERLHLQEALPHLLPLGTSNVMQAAALESLVPAGAYWRFHLAEPLRKRSSLTLEAAGSAGTLEAKGGKFWTIPLMTPVQRSNAEQEITVESPNEPIGKLVADGALHLQPGLLEADRTQTQLRLHQAVDSPLSPKLLLWTRAEGSPSQLELCDQAKVTTLVCKDGRVYQRIEFRLWRWRERACDMRFPAGTRILAVKLQERSLERLDMDAVAGAVRLTLPIDQSAEFVRCEILAQARPHANWLPGLMKAEIPPVGWPTPPRDVQSRVILESGWTPLVQESLVPVGVPSNLARQSETVRRLRQIWNWGRSWWPYGEQAAGLKRLDQQRQIVLADEARMRMRAVKTMTLSDALNQFALEHLKGQTPLIVDSVALRTLGLRSDSQLSLADRPFWESLGLIYLPCPSGALLTSPQRLQDLGIDGPLHAEQLDEAVRAAIVHGRDAASGFCLAPEWLRSSPQDEQVLPFEMSTHGGSKFGDSYSLSEWESRAEAPLPESIYLIDPVLARIVGWGLAAALALLLWRLQRALTPASLFRATILLLTGAALLAIWSPLSVREYLIFPLVLIATAGFLWSLLRLVAKKAEERGASNSTISHLKTPIPVIALVFLAAAWSATAQPMAPRTYAVFVIDGVKPVVLVPPDLIAKLDELEKQSALGSPGAVLVSAKYVGKAKDAGVSFDVQYEIQSFQDKANLVIPLTGVQFAEGAFLDGAPVYPAPHKNGIAVPIRGKGAHQLRLSFIDRAVLEGDQFQLSFNVPRLAQNEISLHWQTPVLAVHCQQSCGEEKIVTNKSKAVTEWHAQLGYKQRVDLRWTSSATGPASKSVDVREAHYWDLRPASLSLATSLNYSIGKGGLTQLVVLMPDGLHVRAVEALAAPAATPILVKRWAVAGSGDQRKLTVDLVQPVAGSVTLNLDIVPQAFGSNTTLKLALPAPQQGKSVAGLLGYRLDATEIGSSAQNLAVQAISVEDFDRQWKKQSALVLPPASRAYAFQRKAAKAWLEPKIQLNDRHATWDLVWNVEHQFAGMHGKATITSNQEDLIFLEFFVDSVLNLADVSGPDVRRWHVQDSLLQVWLRQPRKTTTLTLSGWRSLPAKGGAAGQLLTLPVVYPLQTQLSAATLAVRPAPGIRVKLETSRSLQRLPGADHRFSFDKTPYEASFRLAPETRKPEASILTMVQRSEQGIEIAQMIRLRPERGRLPTIQLRLKDWPLELPRIDAPGAEKSTLGKTQDVNPKDLTWTLEYPRGNPPGLPQEVFVTVHGRVAKDKQSSVLLPAVVLEGATVLHTWLAWKDVEIEPVEPGKKFAPDKSVKDGLPFNERNGWFKDVLSWNLAPAGQPLKASLPRTAPRTSVRVLASTVNIHPAGAGRWQHRASYWILAPEATDLRVKFPAAVEALSVWIDGRLHSVAQPALQESVMPLEAGQLPRLLEMRWNYGASVETMEAPHIAAVQIDPLLLPAHQRVVWIPVGIGPAAPERMFAPSLIPRLLHEAQAHMQIAAALAAQNTAASAEIFKRVADQQQGFHGCLREAEYAISILKHAQPDADDAPMLRRIKELKEENRTLAAKHRYDGERKAAEKSRAVLPEPFGAAWLPLIVLPNQPSVTLESDLARLSARQSTRSYLIVLGAVLFLVLSLFRHGWPILRALSPEILLVLAVAAMWLFDVSLLGAFVIGMMVLVRSIWLVRTWKRRLAASTAAENGNPPTNGPPPV